MPHSRLVRPRGWRRATSYRLRLLLPALLVLLLSRCGRNDGRAPAALADSARTVRDDAGRAVTLARPARRVLSLLPAQTEIVKLLAGPGVLIARTQWDTDPELARLPSTGNALTPSVEWLAALHPDLVIAWPDQESRNVVARLQSLGIPVYAAAVQKLADIDSTIARFGVLLGQEARADSLRGAIRAELDSVRAAVAGRARPRVLYALSLDPPMAASGATYLGELVELAGGRNVFGDLTTLWPQVSLEEIVRRDPEVIIRPVEDTTTDVLQELRRRAGWRELRAVRDGRVYAVDVNLLNRPGASIGRAAAVLAKAIQP